METKRCGCRTWRVRRLILFWLATASAGYSGSVIVGTEPPKKELDVDTTEVFDTLVSVGPTDLDFHRMFFIQPIRPGENRAIIVTINHKLMDTALPIQFESLKYIENAVEAELPKGPIIHGSYGTFECVLKADAHPISPMADFHVHLATSGALKKISFGFRGNYRDYVGFSKHEANHHFGTNETKSQFAIPLIVTDGQAQDDVDRSKLTIKVSRELSFLKTALLTNVSPPVVECSFDPRAIRATETVSGEIQLLRNGKIVDEVVCFLEPKLPAEIMPSSLLLIPHVSAEEGKFRGMLTIRLRGDNTSPSKTLRNVACKAPSGDLLDVSWEPVGKALYRIQVRVKDEASLQGSTGELRFHVETASGDRFEFSTPFLFPNG